MTRSLISDHSWTLWNHSEQATSVTYDIKPHGKPAFSSSVSGHTLVHSSIMHRGDLNDEWVHPFFTHQHLVKFIRTNSFTIQVPGHIGHWQTSDLDWGEEVVTLGPQRSIKILYECLICHVIYFKVDPTEASLLHTEVCRDLQESRCVTFLLDSWFLVTPAISRCVVSPPAGRYLFLIHFLSLLFTVNKCHILSLIHVCHLCLWMRAFTVVMCTFVFKHITAHLSTIQLQQKHQLNILKLKT